MSNVARGLAVAHIIEVDVALLKDAHDEAVDGDVVGDVVADTNAEPRRRHGGAGIDVEKAAAREGDEVRGTVVHRDEETTLDLVDLDHARVALHLFTVARCLSVGGQTLRQGVGSKKRKNQGKQGR